MGCKLLILNFNMFVFNNLYPLSFFNINLIFEIKNCF
jgi:hypothetical protein